MSFLDLPVPLIDSRLSSHGYKMQKSNELRQIFQSYFDLIAIIQENGQNVQYIYKQKSRINKREFKSVEMLQM